ncbi:hypothetical protein BCR44DRAFT_122023 [Catenaria anguillulae PL171]|uniref:Uncharacterized protein n=1 Tax=Catenaria anguillulae PL171 TaxID=765915 RepID=A0A1Y2HRJ9_9FUNG|nr:hypothetical protein BCR44DRAFT_122023 [Catenaria anguillulae PL171]
MQSSHGPDPSLAVCADFFQFSCGNWIKTHPIPNEKASVGAFQDVIDKTQVDLRAMLESADLPRAPNDTAEVGDKERQLFTKARTLYATCMDTTAINKVGPAPVKALVDKYVNALNSTTGDAKGVDRNALAKVVLEQAQLGIGSLFQSGVTADAKEPTKQMVVVAQGGVGLPQAAFADQATTKTYTQTVAAMFKHLFKGTAEGSDSAKWDNLARGIVAFEAALAKSMATPAETSDVFKTYNPMPLNQFAKNSTALPWELLLTDLAAQNGVGQLNTANPINVITPKYFETLDSIIQSTPTNVLSGYFAWRAASAAASSADETTAAVMDPIATLTTGVRPDKSRDERAKQCASMVDGVMPFAVGRWYVAKAFGGEGNRKAVTDMIESVLKAFDQRVGELPWLDDAAREKAKLKAKSLRRKIAFPDIINNVEELDRLYGSIDVKNGDHFGNAVRIGQASLKMQWSKLSKPTDFDEWSVSPATVNAQYVATTNEIAFPAAFLQTPFFTPGVPDAINFGSFAVVGGHEVSHAFDPSGSNFDEQGRLAPWFSEGVSKEFATRAQCFVDQYSKFTVPGPNNTSINVDGKLTLGENVADNGGMGQAFAAFKATNPKDIRLGGSLSNFTTEQLFYIGYAQMWCGSTRPEAALAQIRTDVHSPGVARVNGAVQNSKDFAKAFSCPQNAPMNPANKCELW